MGLDQYAHWIDSDGTKEEFMYWRKTSHIQDWMEKLYREKGGTEEFNCENVELTEADIVRFVDDVMNKRLQWVGGFFFGPEYDVSAEISNDLKFARECLSYLSEGKKVVYSSWW